MGVVDVDEAKAAKLAEKHDCQAFTHCEDILDKVDAVTIATPTVTHMQLAKVFLRHKIPVLIEKPLASSVREGRKIVAMAKRYDTVCAVGHSERCNPRGSGHEAPGHRTEVHRIASGQSLSVSLDRHRRGPGHHDS